MDPTFGAGLDDSYANGADDIRWATEDEISAMVAAASASRSMRSPINYGSDEDGSTGWLDECEAIAAGEMASDAMPSVTPASADVWAAIAAAEAKEDSPFIPMPPALKRTRTFFEESKLDGHSPMSALLVDDDSEDELGTLPLVRSAAVDVVPTQPYVPVHPVVSRRFIRPSSPGNEAVDAAMLAATDRVLSRAVVSNASAFMSPVHLLTPRVVVRK